MDNIFQNESGLSGGAIVASIIIGATIGLARGIQTMRKEKEFQLLKEQVRVLESKTGTES